MRDNAKRYILAAVAIFVLSSAAFAAVSSNDVANVKITLLRSDPYPAEPNSYLDMVFKVENAGGAAANDVKVRMNPSQTFFIDTGATVRVGNSANTETNPTEAVDLGELPPSEYTLVEYKIFVDKNAIEGNQELQMQYQTNNGLWFTAPFQILVQGKDMLELANVTPSIIAPGKPTNVAFVIRNAGTSSIHDVVFAWSEASGKILPLGSGNINYVSSIPAGESASVPVTLVADPSATAGAYKLSVNINYTIGFNITKSLNMDVGVFVGGLADFDVEMESSQAGSVSLSVANVGSTSATAVSVSVPLQEGFAVTGASNTFLGNINPGDFTLATFQISRTVVRNATQNRMLGVRISYTDTNGNRQVIDKQVLFNAPAAAGAGQGNFARGQQRDNGTTYIIAGIAGIVILVVAFKYRSKLHAYAKKIKETATVKAGINEIRRHTPILNKQHNA